MFWLLDCELHLHCVLQMTMNDFLVVFLRNLSLSREILSLSATLAKFSSLWRNVDLFVPAGRALPSGKLSTQCSETWFIPEELDRLSKVHQILVCLFLPVKPEYKM